MVDRRQDSPHPHWTGFSPDGNYALIPDLGLDQIVIYKVHSSKPAITPHGVGQSVPGGGPRHMRFSIDGGFIYLLNELSLSVTTFAWDDQNGTAKALSTTPAISQEVKAGERLQFRRGTSGIGCRRRGGSNTIAGSFVYSSNRGHDTVSVYRTNPKSDSESSRSFRFSRFRSLSPKHQPDARLRLVARCRSGLQSTYHRRSSCRSFQETGKLTYQRGSVINVPSPICILFLK